MFSRIYPPARTRLRLLEAEEGRIEELEEQLRNQASELENCELKLSDAMPFKEKYVENPLKIR